MLVAIPEAPETSPSTHTPVTSGSNSTSAGSCTSTVSPRSARLSSGKSPPRNQNTGQATVIRMDTQPATIRGGTSVIHSKFQEIREDSESGTGGNSILLRRVVSETNGSGGTNGVIPCNSDFPMMDPVIPDHSFQQQLLQLKQEQDLQHQLLLQRYQAQRQQLAQAHEKQLQQRLKVIEFWELKRRQDEERERIDALKKKDEHEQSAVASTEVKQKLQGFLLNKKQREAAALTGSNSNLSTAGLPMSPSSSSTSINCIGSQQQSPSIPPNASPPFRTWSVVHAARVAQAAAAAGGASPGGDHDGGSMGSFQSHPYRRPLFIPKFDEDFPLRKTASEPNLLKMRLKQRVLDRRSSPLVRRKEKSAYLKRRSYLATEGSGSAGSTPDSGPNSPPISSSGVIGVTRSGSGDRTPQHDDGSGGGGGSPYGSSAYGPASSASVSDLTLYSSPSLPNISLGKPLPPNAESKLAAVSETEARFPIPQNASAAAAGANHILPFPFYTPHHIDPVELEAFYQSGGIMALANYQAQAQAHAQQQLAAAVAQQQAEINSGGIQPTGDSRTGPRRPLGRTQSAPLPLGHPMLVMGQGGTPSLVNSAVGLNGSRNPNATPILDPHQAHQLLRQHIRQTVLTRAGSRGTMIGSLNRTVSVEEDSGEGEAEAEASSAATAIAEQQRASSFSQNKHGLQPQPAVQDLSASSTGNLSVVSAIPQRLHQFHHHHGPRPLARALSSPLVALGPNSEVIGQVPCHGKPGGTGLAFDSLMLKHQCLCGDNAQHPEHPGRLQSIWARLQETGLISMCERVRARKATLEEIQSCHSEAHTLLFGTNPMSRQRMELSRFPESSLPIKSLVRLPCNGIGVDSDTAWNEHHTPSAARMAAGCVLELAFRVAAGDLRNGFAIVRPPGHHAEPVQAMGFCFFNSIAIAARQLRAQFQLEKILLLDWDVHHGNGTQQIFYDDPHILYLSIHRHDEGNFFPGTGGPTECGIEDGVGFNVNIGWGGSLNPPMGDAEYLAAFRSVIMPIAKDFQPDIILVSCGFDAANGHPPPLGGYRVSPACFGWMTQQLMSLPCGKVVLALEGGYDLPAICDSAQECVRALLGEPVSAILKEELIRPPCGPAIETLLRTVAIQTPHWPCIKRYTSLIHCSALEAAAAVSSSKSPEGRAERVESETVSAMASLSMRYHNENNTSDPGGRRQSDNKMHEESSPADLRRSRTSLRGESEEPMEMDDK